MEQLKTLFTAPKPGAAQKDKLAAKKQHEREVHDALKTVQRQKKEEGRAQKEEAKRLFKEERVEFHDTKRAHADARHLAKRAEHKETATVCEHGVVRCRICFPHASK